MLFRHLHTIFFTSLPEIFYNFAKRNNCFTRSFHAFSFESEFAGGRAFARGPLFSKKKKKRKREKREEKKEKFYSGFRIKVGAPPGIPLPLQSFSCRHIRTDRACVRATTESLTDRPTEQLQPLDQVTEFVIESANAGRYGVQDIDVS